MYSIFPNKGFANLIIYMVKSNDRKRLVEMGQVLADEHAKAPKTRLVTLEEWEAGREPLVYVWEFKNGIACPECGAELYDDATRVLTSQPPQYPIFCKECDFTGTRH